jgi:hypothetical protein
VKNVLRFFLNEIRAIDRQLAWSVTQIWLQITGALYLGSLFFAFHSPILVALYVFFCACGWLTLYKLIEGIRAKWSNLRFFGSSQERSVSSSSGS